MKKHTFLSASFLVVGGAIAFSYATLSQQSKVSTADLMLENVEAMSSCEVPNGRDKDGHCVDDGYKNYFCATPGMFDSKDCTRGVGVK